MIQCKWDALIRDELGQLQDVRGDRFCLLGVLDGRSGEIRLENDSVGMRSSGNLLGARKGEVAGHFRLQRSLELLTW